MTFELSLVVWYHVLHNKIMSKTWQNEHIKILESLFEYRDAATIFFQSNTIQWKMHGSNRRDSRDIRVCVLLLFFPIKGS